MQLKQGMVNNLEDIRRMQKYLTFFLNGKIYAVSIMKAKEILEYEKITTIPRMPEYIYGAINIRGKIIPVVDLCQCLEDQSSEITRRSCIVVVEVKFNDKITNVGILVDAVSKVMDFSASDIEPSPQLGLDINADFIEGMAKLEDQFVVLLNIDNILLLEGMDKIAKL